MTAENPQANAAGSSQPQPEAEATAPARSLFAVSAPSMQPTAMNDLLVRMRRPLRAGLVQLSREMLRRMKRLRGKRGSEVELARNSERADRLLEQVRALRRWSPQSLCKSLLGHETPLAEALASPALPLDRLALARLAETRPVREFVAEFRAGHAADWRDLVFYMQYKNTGGRWKRKRPARPRAPGNLLAGSVEAIAATAASSAAAAATSTSETPEGGSKEEDAEQRRRLESVLREFRMETSGAAVTKDAKSVVKGAKSVAKIAKPVAKDASSLARSVIATKAKSVAMDANLAAKDTNLVAKSARPVAKSARPTAEIARPVAKTTKSVVNASKSVAKAAGNKGQMPAETAAEDCPDDGWSDLFATDVPPTEMKRGLHRGRRITTDGTFSSAPQHGDRQSRKRQRDQLEQQRREKAASLEASQLHPSWQAKRRLKAQMAAAAAVEQKAPTRVVFDDD